MQPSGIVHDVPRHPRADVVIPTVGRGSLALLLASLDGPPDRLPPRVIVVDDRPDSRTPLPVGALSPELRERLDVFTTEGRGPAAARNRGWHASRAEWIAFLDDDVIPCRGWLTELDGDLDALPTDVAASRGRVHDSGATDDAARASANIACRRSALLRVGGFDEGATPAHRDDGDLVLRVREAGFRIVDGRRAVVHPTWSGRSRGDRPVRARATRAAASVRSLDALAVVLATGLTALAAAIAGAAWRVIAAVVACGIGLATLLWRIARGGRSARDAALERDRRRLSRTGPPRIARVPQDLRQREPGGPGTERAALRR